MRKAAHKPKNAKKIFEVHEQHIYCQYFTFTTRGNKHCAQHEIYLRAMGGRIAVRPEREISHRKGMKSGFVGALSLSLLPKLVA